MKTVVVFGSGRVARPAIRALLDSGLQVIVATDQPEVAEELLAGHAAGRAERTNAADANDVRAAVAKGDLSISLLPVDFHVRVAEACLDERRPFVTTSYVSEEMRALHRAARRAEVLLLNEIGADPGIDHMQVMQLVHEIRNEGGRVLGVHSVCGGIPSPESNDNPLGYKLSWSTRGVVLAGRRPARYRRDGKLVHVGPFEIFDHARIVEVEGLGQMESYPNGDSVRFEDEYGLPDVRTMFRGSLRWPGWCETWSALARLGFVDEAPEVSMPGSTFEEQMRLATGARAAETLRVAAGRVLDLEPDHAVFDRFEWLGLFAAEGVPSNARSRADLLIHCLDRSMAYAPGERDMLALHHQVDFVDAEGREHTIESSMHELGEPDGDTAMARTVGLPAAFAAMRILDGTIRDTGVRIPVRRSIYEPILADLESVGIRDVKKRKERQNGLSSPSERC